jgi:hypothetical protein
MSDVTSLIAAGRPGRRTIVPDLMGRAAVLAETTDHRFDRSVRTARLDVFPRYR